ncbi:beta-lactamase class A [Enterococcus sp. PF1-24]|uniref:serine hydrolase n=1 Tax=unclassified Enterococcus TaxID=2608891 RepID=UPI002474F8E0|nr:MULTISPECIES: serine hydrolase [unclassified Enterococcus]MDH6363566.1 beta-lactamase class A [Enterococcus sp. PFB1-1]MDH6400801.1 beta-lactamase class A [Enterococcus sp. PF1-24]
MKKLSDQFVSNLLLVVGVFTLIWYFYGLNNQVNAETQDIILDYSPITFDVVIEEVTEEENDYNYEPITADLSQYYVNLSKQLKEVTKGISGDFALVYMDLATGQKVAINGDKQFHGASTTKVPLVMLISDKVAAGELSWQQEIAYEKADYEEGTGTLINDLQPQYKLADLAELTITVSDNVAKNMLYRQLGGQPKGVQEIYATYLGKIVKKGENKISANDAVDILEILYEGSAERKDYQQLIDNMKNTVYKERLETAATTTKVAHKIGTYEANVHDIGIFYGKKPYILTVYTNNVEDAKSIITKVSDKVWQFQEEQYPKK